jgi:hypothetical protein
MSAIHPDERIDLGNASLISIITQHNVLEARKRHRGVTKVGRDEVFGPPLGLLEAT